MAQAKRLPKGESIISGYRIPLQSTLLHTTLELKVRLPPSYQPYRFTYPVLYLLDGEWAFLQATGCIDIMERNGLLPELMLVGIDTPDRKQYFTPSANTDADITKLLSMKKSGDAQILADSLTQEIIPFIDKHYRTASWRGIAGTSLGGLFCAWLLLNRPDPWHAFLISTPSLWWNKGELVKQAKTLIPDIKGQRQVHIDLGSEGGSHARCIRRFNKLLKDLAPKKVQHRFHSLPHEDHGLVLHACLRLALQQFLPGMPLPARKGPWTRAALERHYQRLGKKLSIAARPSEAPLQWCAEHQLAQGRPQRARDIFTYGLEWYGKNKRFKQGLKECDRL